MKKQNSFQKTYSRFICLLLMAVLCKTVYSQQNEDNPLVYLLKKDWSAAKNMKEATYFMQLVPENDTTYICRYYNKFGSMIRQESFLDSLLTIPNGRFCWYDQNGMLDSTGLVNRKLKTGAWKYYDDNGAVILSIIYNNGLMVEKKDFDKKELMDAKEAITHLLTKENTEPNTGSAGEKQFRQVSFGESDSAEKQWKDYLKEHIAVPERFISIYQHGFCTAVVSFTINKEGKLGDIYLTHSCEWSADNAVLNAFKNSPPRMVADQYEESAEHSLQQAVTFHLYGLMNIDSLKKAGVYIGAQVQARFPGGAEAWKRFLASHLNSSVTEYNHAPNGQYIVVVSFLVEKDGTVSEIKAENNPGYGTAEEAIRVFKKSPKWIPAMQDGKPVIYRQKQAITFTIGSVYY